MLSAVDGNRNRNSWSPMMTTSSPRHHHPDDEDEHLAEECTERMMSAQMRQLDPLKEDLADWINKTLNIDYVDRDNFLAELDNGVILCHLALLISERAQYAIDAGVFKGSAPTIRAKCFERAMRRSFFSRDNMENFIRFCRSLGVHDNLLFESDDLVLHHQPRNVVLCLLEVARIATRFGVEPPGLVQLEKEIADEERGEQSATDAAGLSALLSWQFQTAAADHHPSTGMRLSSSANDISAFAARMLLVADDPAAGGDPGASDGVPSDTTEDEWSRGSGEDPETPVVRRAVNELDRKVQQATRLMQKNCNCVSGKCSKLAVKKVGEGKYNIAGRNVFVRLLKGRHMMVRVGGGWDTLDHFLLRHDPCQVKVVSRTSKDVREGNASKYLHIRAKYRSPPPMR